MPSEEISSDLGGSCFQKKTFFSGRGKTHFPAISFRAKDGASSSRAPFVLIGEDRRRDGRSVMSGMIICMYGRAELMKVLSEIRE